MPIPHHLDYFVICLEISQQWPPSSFSRVFWPFGVPWDSLVAQMVKCLPTVRETWVRSLGQKDPLEKEVATHSSTHAWKIPWTVERSRLQSMGSQSRTRLSDFTSLHLRFPMNFSMIFVFYYCKNCHGNFDIDSIESLEHFGNVVILRILHLRIHEYGCLFIYFYLRGLLSEHLLVFNVQVFHLLDSFVPKYSTPFSAIVNRNLKWSESCLVVSDSLQPHGLYSPWNSPGQNTGVGSLSLLQGIFPTQGLNPGLPHCRQILYQLSHKGSPRTLEWVACPFSSRSSGPRNQTGVFCIAGRFFTNWAIPELSGKPIVNRIVL